MNGSKEESYGRQENTEQRRARAQLLPDGDFEQFWAIFPKRVARLAAAKAWGKALKKASAARIIDGARRYAAERQDENPQYTRHPAKWLDGGGWMDEPGANGSHREAGFADIQAEISRRIDEERGEPAGTHERKRAADWERACADEWTRH